MSATARPRILVVDDIETNVRLLEAILVAWAMPSPLASSGEEALERWPPSRPT
jgi:CheY-like chemotaxis protein